MSNYRHLLNPRRVLTGWVPFRITKPFVPIWWVHMSGWPTKFRVTWRSVIEHLFSTFLQTPKSWIASARFSILRENRLRYESAVAGLLQQLGAGASRNFRRRIGFGAAHLSSD